jgi:hypothetical protein
LRKVYENLAKKIETKRELTDSDFRQVLADAKLGDEIPRDVANSLKDTPPGTPALQSCRLMMSYLAELRAARQPKLSLFGRLWKFLGRKVWGTPAE